MTPNKTTAEVLPLTEKQYTAWKTAIEKARKKRKDVAEEYTWDENLRRYKPARKGRRKKDINLGLEFSDTERKRAALWFDVAHVALTDYPPELAPAVTIQQEILNEVLGPNHADVHPVVLQAIFNCLCPAGVGPVLVGYHCTKVDVTQDVPVSDPATGQPLMVPDEATGQPVPAVVPQTVPVPIWEEWFVRNLSPKSLLLPADLKSTNYQKDARWIGYDWEKPLSQVRREYHLPDTWTGHGSEGDRPYFTEDDRPSEAFEDEAGDPLIRGCTLWYHADLYAEPGQTVHPKLVRVLTLADGVTKPLEHRDSPDQTILTEGPDAGRLSPDSVIGFNIRPLVLRDLTDEAWVPSDAAMTAALTEEQTKYRENALRKRDTNVTVIAYEAELQEAVENARKSAGTGETVWVPVPDGALAANRIQPLAQAVAQRETYQDQEILRQDRARILGIDNNQTGVNAGRKQTATEAATVQRNTEARFEQERMRVRRWFLYDIVKPIDALILRYMDQRTAAGIVGPQKAQVWFQAKSALAGGYRYTLQMDSGKYIDVEQQRQQVMNLVNFAAKAPNVNQDALWQEVCQVFGKDPTQFLRQPPPPAPEPPKLTLSISATNDLNPMAPQYANVVALIQATGIQVQLSPPTPIDPMQAMAAAQGAGTNTHGGPAEKAERIDQKTADLTGRMDGQGAPLGAAMGMTR